MKFLFFFLFSFSLFAQRSEDNLTQTLAQKRGTQIQEVAYQLDLEVNASDDIYDAVVLITLKLKNPNEKLIIDTFKHKIKNILVNNLPISDYQKTDASLEIPAKHLKPETTVKIEYQGNYDKEASGFLRSVDPEDDSVYIFTDFEPYFAHHLFPCFDQPDLKAKFKLTVRGPKEWIYINNELIDSEKTNQNQKMIVFKETKPISPYLFFFGAGPFEIWEDEYGDDNLPLTLYARKTLAKYVDYKNIFKTTKKGLKFFEDYFDYKYPFSKFGQVFVPEFSWGGMENPGAITLNERNIFRGPVSASRYEGRDSLILHEMAHMWFGDLVTMQWWNDLWLNESFATYLATLAQVNVLPSSGIWPDFFSTKCWGYWQDQLVTTHPIETPVPDVRVAKSNFDGITYAKGASSLKQLHFFVGEDGFKKGIQNYFDKFAFKNATRFDFIKEIELASNVKLTDWTTKWLQTQGLNKINVEYTCTKDQKISTFQILQYPSVSNTLSPHKSLFAFLKIVDGKFKLIETREVSFFRPYTNMSSFKGIECPDFVFPNWEDHDYALYSLDKISLTKAKEAMTQLESPLARYMIWSNLGQMVRDRELKVVEFFEYVKEGLKIENDDLILGLLLGKYSFIRNQYFNYLNNEQRKTLAPELEKILMQRVAEAKKGSSTQMNFFDFYVSIATTPEAQTRLFEMLNGKSVPGGIEVDQDRRWSLVKTLAGLGYNKVSEIIDGEDKKDPSALGKRNAYSSRASLPDLENKKRYWDSFFNDKNLNFTMFSEAAGKIHHPVYPEMSTPFVDSYFKKILAIDWNSSDALVENYFEKLFPGSLCSNDLLNKSKISLGSAGKLTSMAKRAWREANDELARCVKVRAKK